MIAAPPLTAGRGVSDLHIRLLTGLVWLLARKALADARRLRGLPEPSR